MDASYENLMQLLMGHRKQKQILKLKTISLKQCKHIESTYQTLDKDMQSLFLKIFTNSEPTDIELQVILPFQPRKTAMPVCNKMLNSQEIVYRCYDCTTHESAVLCLVCFENGDHQGHRFAKIGSGGGNCDCGNPDAIAEKGFCKHHSGKGQQMIINQTQELVFNKYMRQLFIWILKLYSNHETTPQAEQLMIHLILVLDWLNTESLYYNTLTNKLLFNGKNQMIDHILVMGTKNMMNGMAKKGTELFLKMFSLDVFKENLAHSYLMAYNTLEKFESTKFQSLFIQLFANNDLVERVVNNNNISLDPRKRQHNVYSYYSSLMFMSTIRSASAKAFFVPLIEKGGVQLRLLDEIQQKCEKNGRPVEQFLQQGINLQNIYYTLSKVIIKLIQGDSQLMKKEIVNKYRLIKSHSFIKNKIVLSYQRVFVVAVYAYFQFDYRKINAKVIADILEISLQTLREFVKKICEQFLLCLNEFAKTLAYVSYGRYSFESYNDLYCRNSNGNMVILMDMLGIKFCCLILDQLGQKSSFQTIFLRILKRQNQIEVLNTIIQEGSEMFEDEDHENQNNEMLVQAIDEGNTKSSILFSRQWMSLIGLLIETIIINRPEITLSSQLNMKSQYIDTIYQHQFKKLILNKKELSLSQFDEMIKFWFKDSIDKNLISKYMAYDKNRKKYVLREEVRGVEMKKEYLISLMKCSDNYLKKNENVYIDLSLEITQSMAQYRHLIFSPGFLYKTYKLLLNHIRMFPEEDLLKELKNMITSLKLLQNLLEEENAQIDCLYELIYKYFSGKEKIMKEIKVLLQKNKEGELNMMAQTSQEQSLKRKELLKKKKEEKLKNIKKNYNKEKVALQKNVEAMQQQKDAEICIYCHENSSEKSLFYLASLFSSNIVYSVMKLQGVNPYFQSCFHSIHNECFIECCKNKEKILCPLCKSICNILLIDQKDIAKKESFDIFKQKLEIAFSQEYKYQFENIFVEIVKSLIQFYFHRIINQKHPNPKETKIYTIVAKIVQQEYKNLSEQAKQSFIQALLSLSTRYVKSIAHSYNFHSFVDIIIRLLVAYLKEESMTFVSIETVLLEQAHKISYKDLDNIYQITKDLYSLPLQDQLQLNRSESLPESELKTYYLIFEPPKTITDLLIHKKNIQNEHICKLGHSICICLICLWRGCLDCKKCFEHTLKLHNKDCIFFNFVTGSLHHFYISAKVDTRSLYSNQVGQEWFPKYGKEEYYLQIELYNKIMDGLKNGNLAKTIRNNYESLKPSSMID